MVRSYLCFLRQGTPLTVRQHCIFSWLKQESSQEKCPMCRQRESLLVELGRWASLTLWCSFQVEKPGRACGRGPTNSRTEYQSAIRRNLARKIKALEQDTTNEGKNRDKVGAWEERVVIEAQLSCSRAAILPGVWMIPQGVFDYRSSANMNEIMYIPCIPTPTARYFHMFVSTGQALIDCGTTRLTSSRSST
jgi:hypothetical protein